MPKSTVTVKLVGENGNVFVVIGKTVKELQRAGHHDLAKEYKEKCFNAKSYDEVLQLTMQYVEVE